MSETEFEICPFTVVVDSNEGAPFQFTGIKGKKVSGERKPIVVRTVKKPLWNWGRDVHGVGLADYSIDGIEDEIQIERKSVSDLFSTLGDRRDGFEAEIKRLNSHCIYAAVVIEGGYGHISSFHEHGPEPSSVIGTILAWSQRYPGVHWIPAGSRDMAERLTFRILERYWNDKTEKEKRASKTADSNPS